MSFRALCLCSVALMMCLLIVPGAGSSAQVWHVDDGNLSGQQDGSERNPFASPQAAANAAACGDVIKIAAGSYGPVDTRNKSLTLQGGYPGADAATYAAGQGGDFSGQVADPERTVLSGGPTQAGVTFTRNSDAAYHGRLDNFTIRESRKGVVCDTSASWPHPDNLSLTNMLIEDNGSAGETTRGAGVLICGNRASIENSTIRNNHGGRGAGISGSIAESLEITGNQIENNVCYDDHGGGVYLVGPVSLSENLIAGNRIAMDYGWGGGVLLHSPATRASLHGNVIRNNYAPSYGGGIFVDEGATVFLNNNLIHHNRTAEGIGGGVAVDDGTPGPSEVHLRNCTVAFNNPDSVPDPYSRGGNGLFLDSGSTVTAESSIFWGNGDDFYVREGSTLSLTYSLSAEPQAGIGNISADPLFVNPSTGDFHLQSRGGRFTPQTGAWVADAGHSPAIDAGDPASPYGDEPQPNGSRLNLGAYGNTAQASKSSGEDPDIGQAEALFNWIEFLAPELFPARPTTAIFEGIAFRHYPQTNVFLATFQDNLYFIDPAGFVSDLGPVGQWLPFASS